MRRGPEALVKRVTRQSNTWQRSIMKARFRKSSSHLSPLTFYSSCHCWRQSWLFSVFMFQKVCSQSRKCCYNVVWCTCGAQLKYTNEKSDSMDCGTKWSVKWICIMMDFSKCFIIVSLLCTFTYKGKKAIDRLTIVSLNPLSHSTLSRGPVSSHAWWNAMKRFFKNAV